MGKTKGKRRPLSEQKQTKEQVQQHGFKEAHILAMVNKRTKRKEKNVLPQNKNKPRRKCRGVVSLSRNIAFFCFPLFFSYSADTFRDEVLVASLFES